jgi:hypothetical protein
MEESDQLHASVALSRGKGCSWYPLDRRLVQRLSLTVLSCSKMVVFHAIALWMCDGSWITYKSQFVSLLHFCISSITLFSLQLDPEEGAGISSETSEMCCHFNTLLCSEECRWLPLNHQVFFVSQISPSDVFRIRKTSDPMNPFRLFGRIPWAGGRPTVSLLPTQNSTTL